jgi:RNA polymerase sigma-70 factor, ECF subfamily
MDTANRAQKMCEAARAARPELALDDGAFVAFLHARPERLEASPEHAGDLALSFACANGDTAAIRALEAEYLSRVAYALPSRHRGDAAEVIQSLRDKLLVPGPAGPAKIGDFTGRGGLGGWLRVAAVRVALNIERSKKHEVALDENRALAERAAGDLEIDHLKNRYRLEFREAFTAALEALEARPRNLLRQHYLDGLTMEAIGAIYRVHRITVVRWMEQSREALAKETRRELGARLRVDRNELESILRLIESQMEMSLRAFLG